MLDGSEDEEQRKLMQDFVNFVVPKALDIIGKMKDNIPSFIKPKH